MEILNEENKRKFCYDYPMPAIASDVIVISKVQNLNYILLIQRLNDPYKGYWCLPGGFMEINEKIIDTAKRELFEETNLLLNDLTFFSYYDSINRDPRGRVISFVFYTILNYIPNNICAKDDAKTIDWFMLPLNDNIKLAFDHNNIINDFLYKVLYK